MVHLHTVFATFLAVGAASVLTVPIPRKSTQGETAGGVRDPGWRCQRKKYEQTPSRELVAVVIRHPIEYMVCQLVFRRR
ncbi:hypothetical protein J3R30DRAFT_754202 [Lentinula aciculospora]|uniref:Secreted protein n=1 Tax=Lentinula aciculospora TaxID=153920 RepID=A0A9W9A406_9AGAR|nr:hypothetical protein J3R30DRAFT_754202 [Lentinula aciculospora]